MFDITAYKDNRPCQEQIGTTALGKDDIYLLRREGVTREPGNDMQVD